MAILETTRQMWNSLMGFGNDRVFRAEGDG